MNLRKLLFVLVLVFVGTSLASAGPVPSPQPAVSLQAGPPDQPFSPAGAGTQPPAFSPMEACTANYLRGDFDGDGNRTISDALDMINCVFLGASSGRLCLTCICDMNCDRKVTPADVQIELRLYALGLPFSRSRIICLEGN